MQIDRPAYQTRSLAQIDPRECHRQYNRVADRRLRATTCERGYVAVEACEEEAVVAVAVVVVVEFVAADRQEDSKAATFAFGNESRKRMWGVWEMGHRGGGGSACQTLASIWSAVQLPGIVAHGQASLGIGIEAFEPYDTARVWAHIKPNID